MHGGREKSVVLDGADSTIMLKGVSAALREESKVNGGTRFGSVRSFPTRVECEV